MTRKGWKRREWNAVPADPTAAVSWEWRWKKLHIRLTAIWEVEGTIYFGARSYRSYGGWCAKKLFDRLEGRYQEKQDKLYENDEYSREHSLKYYE